MNNEKIRQLEDKNKELEALNSKLEADVSIIRAQYRPFAQEFIQSEDEIEFKELWKAIWSGKWIIIGITSVFVIASVLIALWLPNEYKSTAILSPASSSSSSLSKLASQFGGLASLAGVNLGAVEGDDKTLIAMELIKTWGFLEKFIRKNNIEVEVFAVERWNLLENKLIVDDDLYDIENHKWIRDFNPDKGETLEPSSWELYEAFRDRVSISQDKNSGLISLSVEYYSPIVAQLWVTKLIKMTNQHLQKQDRQEAQSSIKYLKEQIQKTNVAEMQTVFYQLIEEQTKTLMLAEISDEYVFKILSPAKIAEEESKPKRALIAILGTILGGLIGLIIVLVRNYKGSKYK